MFHLFYCVHVLEVVIQISDELLAIFNLNYCKTLKQVAYFLLVRLLSVKYIKYNNSKTLWGGLANLIYTQTRSSSLTVNRKHNPAISSRDSFLNIKATKPRLTSFQSHLSLGHVSCKQIHIQLIFN